MVWVVGFMVFSATLNNIPVISWRSVLLVKETGGPGKNHHVTDTLSHKDTNGVVRIRKSQNRQHNGQRTKYKRTTNDVQNTTQKTKDRATPTILFV
jgi:hypothetical protein